MGTAIAPVIGYEHAAVLVKEAYASGRTVSRVPLMGRNRGSMGIRSLAPRRTLV